MSACSVCSSKSIGAIEAALAAGETKSGISRRYGVSRFALTRHAEHVVEGVLVEAERPVLEGRLHDLDGRLVGLEAVLQRALDQAIASGKTNAVTTVSREIRQTLESIAKLRGQLDERPVVNLAVIPEFRAVTSRLLASLADFPEARFAAAKALAGEPAREDVERARGEAAGEEPDEEVVQERLAPPIGGREEGREDADDERGDVARPPEGRLTSSHSREDEAR